MSKIETKTETQHTLKLTTNEVIYLKGLLQNYLGEGEEPIKGNKIRQTLWETLNQVNIINPME